MWQFFKEDKKLITLNSLKILNDYLRKILSANKVFENESILNCDAIVPLDLSEIHILRVNNKFLIKNIEALKVLKNVKNIP